MTRHLRIELLLLAAVFALAAAAVPYLPESVPVHWNAAGEPDRWAPRWIGAFVLPVAAAGTWALARWLTGRVPELDESARRAVARFNAGLLAFFLLLEAATIASTLGLPVPVDRAAVALVGAGFAGIGVLLPRIPPNPWIGVRTPWTLADARVWELTHRFAAPVSLAAGAVALGGALLPRPFHLVVGLGAVAGGALVPVVYSFVIREPGA